MSHPNLDRLSEILLQGGIAPKHVRRYIAELKDHAADLMRDGASPDDAWAQIGAETELADAMLARTELKSLCARYPVTVFGLGPALGLLLAYVLAVAMLIGLGITSKSFGFGWIEMLRGPVEVYCWFVARVLPILVGIGFVFTAISQRHTSNWLIVGIVVICVLGACANMVVAWPTAEGVRGTLQFGFGFAISPFVSMGDTLAGETLPKVLTNLAILSPGLIWLRYAQFRSAQQLHD